MLLRFCRRLLMTRRKTVTACNGRFKKRRDSAVRTLVAETLVLAKTHGYVEKIEDELEQELARDIRPPPAERLNRLRREGDKIFKSKYMLLTVVILCILDCALVLGELTLDLHKVKVKLDDTELFTTSTEHFTKAMKHKHTELQNLNPYIIFQKLLKASINFNSTSDQTLYQNASCVHVNQTRYPANGDFANDMLMLKVDKVESLEHKADLELFGTIAHGFHYCSIAILGVLVIETLLKAMCAGSSFFHRKLEVFDAFIVVMSFLVDFCFIVFLPDIDTKDFVFILAILLPWRVIRVVNSLVVSVKDHEHFRLKLVYKRKKKIQGTLRDTETQMQKYRMQATCLQRLCVMEGIDEWKIDHSLRVDGSGSVPATPGKKKFKLRFDDPFGHNSPSRAPRFSLPSLDIHGIFPSNNLSKPRSSLPSVAFNTIKQHISKTLPSRRASLATTDVHTTKLANGDLRRKKIHSDDLTTMQNTIHEDQDFDSAVSSRATSSEEVFPRNSISDHIRVGSRYGRYMERHHSVEEETSDENKLMKMMQEPRRRLSETAVIEKDKENYQLTGFEDALVGQVSKPAIASGSSESSLQVIYAIKQDPSYGNLEYMDTDNSNVDIESDAAFKGKEAECDTTLTVEDNNFTDNNINDNGSAIIECETETVNPTLKLHTAESSTNIKDSTSENHFANNGPNGTIVHECSQIENVIERPRSASET